ncbi:MAG: CHAT domain-containing protein [Okeania sp. SIO1H6]|nr:CHAT domain-containing protein [Okeania sp. SIO1H6]
MGDNAGSDADEKVIRELIPDAEICWLIIPQRSELDEPLWQKSWDILFFAGHGNTNDDGNIGTIHINAQDKLTISEIKNHLLQAVKSGLKLAIFNACDGLGLAYQLAEGEDLHLPQIIVMRENLPVAIAPQFLQYFLENYTQGLSLYSSLRESRQRLQILEKDFPCVSWLPVLCQNPAEIPPRWLELGGKIQMSPYKGLSSFTENDTEIFFGRKVLTNSLLSKVARQNLVAVIGASGSGKSSLVAAGLIPQWLAQATEFLPRFVVKIRPGFPHPNPWENLAEELGKISPNLTANDLAFLEFMTNLEANSGELAKCLTAIVQEKKGCQILLVIDQFEELYTLCSEEKRRSFLAGLVEAVRQESWKVVLTLRADFLSLVLDEDLGKIFDERDKLITPMNDEELKEAIALPAQKFEVEFTDELIKRMIQDYRQNSCHLPMLQFALEELWKRQKYGVISLASYEEIGGLTQVLGDYAENIYINLSQEEKEQARYIFTQLVQPISQEKSGEVSRIATRKIATLADIGKENWQLVIKFADEGLVVTNKEKDVASVELIHEVLITAWSRLKNWIEQDWEFRRWQEKLRDNLSQWEQEKKDDFLLQGGLLKEAESWLEKAEQKITETERRYVEKSRKRRERERQKLIGALTGGLAMVSLFAVGAVWQWRRAVVGEKNAVMKANIATLETRFASEQLDGLVEGIKIGKELKDADWATIENRIQGANMLRKMVDVEGWKEFSLLEGSDFEFSPDGSIIASFTNTNNELFNKSGIVNTIKLWETDGNLVATLAGHEEEVNHVAFSPDGNLIASASNDTTVKLWKPDGTLVATLVGHEEEVSDVVFSPDGNLIASASNDTTVKLWKPDGTLVATLVGHDKLVNDVVFSPNGNLIASASDDDTVRLWTPDGSLVATLKGHQRRVHTVVFSPDGKLIASASEFEEVTIRIWKPDGSLVTAVKFYNEIIDFKFSPDGKFVVSSDPDGVVEFWKLDGTNAVSLEGHFNTVYSFAFNPDGNLIASGGVDGTVKVWKPDGTLVYTLAHPFVGRVAFSPDGSTLATGGGSNTIKLWKKKISTPIKYEHNLMTEISPNANIIATYSDNKVWEINGSLVVNLQWDRESTVSPDGKLVASINEQTLEINKLDGTLLAAFKYYQGYIENIVFSPDGKLIASISDETIKIWKLDGTLLAAFKHYQNSIEGIVFSPDSQLIASAADYENIKVWKLDGTLMRTFEDFGGTVFSRDSKLIAISSVDGKVKLYKTDGSLVHTFASYSFNFLFAPTFSPDGQLIFNSGLGGIKIHKLDGTLIESPNAFPLFVGFSPEGYLVAIVTDYDTASQSLNSNFRMWNLDTDTLLKKACDWVGDYLSNNPNVSEEDKHLCDDIK